MRPKCLSAFRIILLSIILIILAGVGWYYLKPAHSIRNVVLISIDTCRADHLSCYGFNKPTTPNIDAIAKEATLYTNAYTTIPLTLPAHCSILTGTYPPYHGVHDNSGQQLAASNITLPEILQKNGFYTAGIVSAFTLNGQFGINQGFDSYNDKFINPVRAAGGFERRGDETTGFAIEFIKQRAANPFFLFLHYFDPHTQYDPPAPFDQKFADDPYAGEIAFADYCLGQVIKTLKDNNLYDSTLLIILGDHGEGLGEHSEAEHGYYIYQSTVHVPLLIRYPKQQKGTSVDDVVSLVDVVPTILSLLDIPVPDHIQGRDLSKHTHNNRDSTQKRHVYCESLTPTKFDCNPLFGIINQHWKYIDTTQPELYNLRDNPDESQNLLHIEDKQARLMKGLLQNLIAQIFQNTSGQSTLVPDAESRKRLESLGYVGGKSVNATLVMDPSKADPKERIGLHENTQKLIYLIYNKQLEEALRVCDESRVKWPDMPDPYLYAGSVYYKMENYEKTIANLARYVKLIEQQGLQNPGSLEFDPENPFSKAHNLLGTSYFKTNQYAKAAEQYLILIKTWDDVPASYDNLAASYFKLEKYDLAIENWNKSLSLLPGEPEVYNNLALAYYKTNNYEKAMENWSRALKLRPNWEKVDLNLKIVKAQIQTENNIRHYENILKENPDDKDSHNNLAAIYYQQENIEQAIIHWNETVRLEPENAQAHNDLATAYYKQNNIQSAIVHFSKALELKPKWIQVMNNLAWLLATAPQHELRNPAEAIRIAEQACELTEFQQTDILDTLGVAYAAAGQFTEAVSAAEKAMELAQKNNNPNLADEIRKRIELYQNQKPRDE